MMSQTNSMYSDYVYIYSSVSKVFHLEIKYSTKFSEDWFNCIHMLSLAHYIEGFHEYIHKIVRIVMVTVGLLQYNIPM